MIPNDAPIIQMLRPGTDEAVFRAIHDSAPIRFHKRYGIGTDCSLCPSEVQVAIEAKLEEFAADELAPWQRKLALEVLDAKSVELDAVVEEAAISPALQEYLDRHELAPDRPTPSYEGMTAKELRPLASAAGMKGARVAKKSDMVEFLAHQGCGCTGNDVVFPV